MLLPDDVANAILQAIISSSVTGATNALGAAYEKVKMIFSEKYGEESPTVRAIDDLERSPESAGRRMLLSEALSATDLVSDPEVKSALLALESAIERVEGTNTSQHAAGRNIAQADRQSTASVTITQASKANG